MIRLTRNRNTRALHHDFTGPGLLENLSLLADARSRTEKISFTGPLRNWGKMKELLEEESHHKCAYCECNTKVVSYGDVEHFRPKSIYWWLALCVDNYTFACQICNQKHKRKRFHVAGIPLAAPILPFPLSQDSAERNRLLATLCPDPATTDDAALLALWGSEEAFLPHSYLEDPEPLFAWQAIETNREVELILPPDPSPRASRAFIAATECLNLNHSLLRQVRYSTYSALRLAVFCYQRGDQLVKSEALLQIHFMCQSNQQFAGMCRYFTRRAGIDI